MSTSQENTKYDSLQYTYDATFANYLVEAGLVPVTYDFGKFPDTDIIVVEEVRV